MHLKTASIATALAAVLTVGAVSGQAFAAPGDFHHGPRGPRPCEMSVYDALTPEKQAQYDAIVQDFADKTAALRDKLTAKYLELRTLGDSPTPDPKAVGKATEELVALRNEFAKERQGMVERIAKEVGINVLSGQRGRGYPCDGPRRCPATGMTLMPSGPQSPTPPAEAQE